jgi:hypothetical protein
MIQEQKKIENEKYGHLGMKKKRKRWGDIEIRETKTKKNEKTK